MKYIFLFFFIFFIYGISPAAAKPPQVCLGDDCVSVEIASKESDLERGLMYRTRLDENKGMIFVFNVEDKHSFWMKNMHFNLDILWIGADRHIVYIAQNTPACTQDPCSVYTPDRPGQFVLELNSGYTASHHWKIGDKLAFSGILEK